MASSFKASNTVITLTDHKGTMPPPPLGFGRYFADHMLTINHEAVDGWTTPKISPYGPLPLMPSAVVFHYGLSCFEGMKAYYGVDKKIRLFRPELNMKRLQKSSARLALPEFDGPEFLECIKKLVQLDREWVPKNMGESLYIRPTHIGTTAILGVGPSRNSCLFVINSPVGAYFEKGFKPVSLIVDTRYTRAWPGGTGDTKAGANYAQTILPQSLAKGYDQCLWVFGDKHVVTEAGTMNFFMHWKNEQGVEELVTPPLDGTILEGVTRQTVLDLTRKWGEFQVSERLLTMSDVVKAINEKRVTEMFCAGTAATICAIAKIGYKGVDYEIPVAGADGIGKLGRRISDAIFDIQYGVTKDHPWAPVIA